MNKLKDFLSNFSVLNLFIKLSILTLCVLVGLFVRPFLWCLVVFFVLFMLFEKNINSFLYILFLFPFSGVLNANIGYNISFWFIIVSCYVVFFFILHVYKILRKTQQINFGLLFAVFVLAVYFALPIGSREFNFLNILESWFWLGLFYIVFINAKWFKYNLQIVCGAIGVIVSSAIGIFHNVIPYLKENIVVYYTYGQSRFSGLMTNPNIFYGVAICFAIALFVQIFNEKMDLRFGLLVIPILFACWNTISRTYLFILIAIFLFVCISIILKPSKKRVLIFTYFTCAILAVFLICWNQSMAYFSKEIAAPIIDVNSNQILDVGSEALNGRLEIWGAYLDRLIKTNGIIFGIGINSANNLAFFDAESNTWIVANSHNAYIQVLYEIGVVGILLILILFIAWMCKNKKYLKQIIFSLSYLPLLVFCLNCCTENLFLSQLGNMLFIVGVITVYEYSHEKQIVLNKSKIINNTNKIAVLTPTFNREKLLSRAYESLVKQTNKNFAWYVVDDGSSDKTKELVEKFKKENKIEINYYFKENGGKHTALNFGIDKIVEDYFIILDSDDVLLDTAIEIILEDIKYLPVEFCGIGYLKGDLNKKVVGKNYSEDGVIDTFINERYNRNTYGDKAEVFKTKILKKHPFPVFEGERFLSESTIWCQVSGKHKMVFYNKLIYLCEYQNNGLSANVQKTLFKNPKGASACYKVLSGKEFSFQNRAKYTILFIVHMLVDGQSFGQIIKKSSSKFLAIVLYPMAKVVFKKRKRNFNL